MAAVAEYVRLSYQLTTVDVTEVERLYDRLDQLWYDEMTSSERDEAEALLAAKLKDAEALECLSAEIVRRRSEPVLTEHLNPKGT